MTVHGGDIWQTADTIGVEASELLDFSANINPAGLPAGARKRLERDAMDAELLRCYPDPTARRLREALSRHLNVLPDAILVGSGAESLLDPIVRSLRPRTALVPVPAFGEYRRVCEQNGVEFFPFPLRRADLFQNDAADFCRGIEKGNPELVILNNPHNPSGSIMSLADIAHVVDATIAKGATVLLDEAFIDYAPQNTLVRQAAERPGFVVLRSLTKFYGCPALRVGYAVAHPDTIRQVQSLLPTWPVTQLAMDALGEAVTDHDYAATTLRQNTMERERLAKAIDEMGLFVFPSAANYLFLELPGTGLSASALRAALISKHRILIRNCDSYEGLEAGRYVRVAVRSAADNGRLVSAFREELHRQ